MSVSQAISGRMILMPTSPAPVPGDLERLKELALDIEEAITRGKIKEAKEKSRLLLEDGRLLIARVILENRHANPHPVAESLVRSLSHSEIQFEDELKSELAQTARLFLELTAFKCSQENRELRPDTVEFFKAALKSLHDASRREKNPDRMDDHILYHFNIVCCQETLKVMDIVDYVGFFEDLITVIMEQSIETAISRIKILKSQLGKNWFADLLYISWFSTLCHDNIQHLESIKSELTELATKYPEVALAGVEIYYGLIQTGTYTIKEKALEGLIELANLRGSFRSGTFWKARFRAIRHLSMLAHHRDTHFQEIASMALLHLDSRERNKHVRSLFERIEKDPQIIEKWKLQFADESFWSEKEREKQEIDAELDAIKTQQQLIGGKESELENLQDQKATLEENLEHLKGLLWKQVNALLDDIFDEQSKPAFEMPKSYLCPITGQAMVDPVTAPSGHTYERFAIISHLRSDSRDPMTMETLREEQLIPNRALRDAIEDFFRQQAKSTESSPQQESKKPSRLDSSAINRQSSAPPSPASAKRAVVKNYFKRQASIGELNTRNPPKVSIRSVYAQVSDVSRAACSNGNKQEVDPSMAKGFKEELDERLRQQNSPYAKSSALQPKRTSIALKQPSPRLRNPDFSFLSSHRARSPEPAISSPSGFGAVRVNALQEDLRARFPSLTIIDKEDWENNVDLKALNMSVSDLLPLNRDKIIPILEDFSSLPIENDAGITVLTLPKNLTLNKLMKIAVSPKKGKVAKLEHVWEKILQEIGDIPVDKSYRVVISNNILKGTRGLDSFHPEEHAGCEAPKAIEIAALFIQTYMSSGKTLYLNDPTAYTRCKEGINDDWQVVVGGAASEGLYMHIDNYEESNYGMGAVKRVE